MKELSIIYQKVTSKRGKSTGRNKYYVNIMNEMIRLHLNKLEYEIVKDDTEEINGWRMGLCI